MDIVPRKTKSGGGKVRKSSRNSETRAETKVKAGKLGPEGRRYGSLAFAIFLFAIILIFVGGVAGYFIGVRTKRVLVTSEELARIRDEQGQEAAEAGAIDSDGDGLLDSEEDELGFDKNDGDMDDDGLSDGEEVELGTDPRNADTDGDGFADGVEVDGGFDPLARPPAVSVDAAGITVGEIDITAAEIEAIDEEYQAGEADFRDDPLLTASKVGVSEYGFDSGDDFRLLNISDAAGVARVEAEHGGGKYVLTIINPGETSVWIVKKIEAEGE